MREERERDILQSAGRTRRESELQQQGGAERRTRPLGIRVLELSDLRRWLRAIKQKTARWETKDGALVSLLGRWKGSEAERRTLTLNWTSLPCELETFTRRDSEGLKDVRYSWLVVFCRDEED